jgi:hypothetical protein
MREGDALLGTCILWFINLPATLLSSVLFPFFVSAWAGHLGGCFEWRLAAAAVTGAAGGCGKRVAAALPRRAGGH